MSELVRQIVDTFQSKQKSMSWIISGSRGSGKHTLINSVIEYLIGRNEAEISANVKWIRCGLTDDSEKKLQKVILAGEDTQNITDLSYKNEITVSDIRDGINFLSMKTANTCKIMVIDLADQMNENAQNSLLKTLEEPYDKTLIFLLSENTTRLLPTIMSRCQKINLHNLTTSEMYKRLQNTYPEQGDIDTIARLSGGIWGIARDICEYDGLTLYGKIKDFISPISQLPYTKLLEFIQEIVQDNNKYNLTIYLLGQMLYEGGKSNDIQYANKCGQLYLKFYNNVRLVDTLYLDKSQFLFNTIIRMDEELYS